MSGIVTSKMRRVAAGLLGGLFGAIVAGGDARASGYLTARFGGDHGHPAIPNAYAVYFNPAALGGVLGSEATLDMSIAIRSVSYTRDASALSPTVDPKADPTYVAANTGKAKLLNVVPLPYAGIVSDLGRDDLRVGFASYVPFGGMASWQKDDRFAGGGVTAGAYDGPQRWHNISGSLVSWYNTGAIAYRFKRARLSVGANVSVIHHSLHTVRARNVDGSDVIETESHGLLEGRSLVEASGVDLGAALGVYWEPFEDRSLKLGLSYTSRPGFGRMRWKGTLTEQVGTQASKAPAEDIDFLSTYPDVIRLGGVYRALEKLELRADVEYVRWSALQYQCIVPRGADCNVDQITGGATPGPVTRVNIPRNWKDSTGVRAGAGYFLNDDVELFASGAVTTSAVPKSTLDASSIDSTRIYASLGGRFRVSEHFVVGASYNHIYFLPVTTTESQYDHYLQPSHTPSANGKYTSTVYFFNTNVTYMF